MEGRETSTTTARKAGRLHRSLENFDEHNIDPPLLTSPRSLEACRRQGFTPEEFVFRYLLALSESIRIMTTRTCRTDTIAWQIRGILS